jgi:GNAT superfamily N-acetyltransferase
MAAGAVAHSDVSAQFRQNTPNPIPVIILARLGVDKEENGRGLGESLLGDAMKRALQSAELVAARAMLIHALDAEAAGFYERLGLKRLKTAEEITFYIKMSDIRASRA